MLAALSPVDYGVLGLLVAGLIAAGLYCSSRQRAAGEFLLAGRSLGALPLGLSLAASLAAGPMLVVLPALGYERGLAGGLVPAALWLALPAIVLFVVPIVRGLSLETLHEYLEHRFDARVRIAASLLFIAWRILWLAAAVVIPSQAISLMMGGIPPWIVIVALGIVATTYSFLGGLRAITWAGAAQACLMLAAVAVVIGGVWWQRDGGPAGVADAAKTLGRMRAADWTFAWTSRESLWAMLPYWFFSMLALGAADQRLVQRYLAAKNVNVARTAFLAAALGATVLLAACIYAGVCLLAFYQTQPSAMRPQWVVNVDGRTRTVIREQDDRELLDPEDPAHEPSWENIQQLVAERRILRPNDKLPFESADELIDASGNRLLVEKLAMRKPNEGLMGGEWVVHRAAPAEMLPHFAQSRLPLGLAGLVLAGLVAAGLAAIDTGLIALGSTIVCDLHRRGGLGRRWLARRLVKAPEQLDAGDELQLARPLTLLLGAVATLAAALIALAPDLPAILLPLTGAIAAPLLGLVLLGMLTRRATAAAALSAAAGGLAFSLYLAGQSQQLADSWTIVLGTLFTFAMGYLLSFVLGRRKSHVELRGLVAGCGTLGIRASQEPAPRINLPAIDEGIRWK